MIQSFTSSDTEQLFIEEKNRRFNAIARVALRKLIQLNRARKIEDLAVPPGNRLEALKGDRAGFHSIRINQQWRIVFRWTESGPADVQIIDYHRQHPRNVIHYTHESTDYTWRNTLGGIPKAYEHLSKCDGPSDRCGTACY